jgi:predicted RNA-binding protein with PIN domain
MPYIIDGHNLIGALPEIKLSDPEDERRLAAALQRYAQETRRSLTVYFDRGQPGAGDMRSGRLTLRFVSGRTADQAIASHLRRLKGDAKNWTVVTSDRAVQAEARAAGARVVSSESFAREMRRSPGQIAATRETPDLSAEEVAQWEDLFKRRRRPDGRSSKS